MVPRARCARRAPCRRRNSLLEQLPRRWKSEFITCISRAEAGSRLTDRGALATGHRRHDRVGTPAGRRGGRPRERRHTRSVSAVVSSRGATLRGPWTVTRQLADEPGRFGAARGRPRLVRCGQRGRRARRGRGPGHEGAGRQARTTMGWVNTLGQHGLSSSLPASGCAWTSSATTSCGSRSAAAACSTSRPTFAVCVDPLAADVEFAVERGTAWSGVRDGRPWSCRCGWTRSGSTCTAPTARRSSRPARTPRAGTGLRDAQRRLGRCAGAAARRTRSTGSARRRAAQPQGPRLHALEHRRARPDATAEFTAGGRGTTRGRTARASSSTPTTSRSRSSTTTRTPSGAMAGSFVDNGYRGGVRLLARPRSTAIRFEGGQYTEYVFAGPRHAGDPRGVHVADRPRGAAAAVGARLPPVPLVRLHPGRGRGARAAPPRARDPVRRALARHRVHGRLPRLHLGPRRSRTRRGCSSGSPSRASA